MRSFTFLATLLTCCIAAEAQSVIPSSTDSNISPPQTTACGDIVRASLDDYEFFTADLAIQCLTSVPFNAAVATRFIAWYNQTLQFHSTSAFLKNPPQEYQQPAEDIFAHLQEIQDKIDSDYYRNQYVFDADVFELVRGGHDGHLDLWAGALSQFSWGAPFQIVSVSIDGREEPKIYFWYNIKKYVSGGEVPSPISTMNGVPVVEFLEQYAALQSFDTSSPHADWNLLMRSPAMQIMGYRSVFSAYSTFYPGKTLETIYQNGTNYTVPWLALYNSPGFTGPLETGGDYYNFFVLGQLPASYDQSYDEYEHSRNETRQSVGLAKRDPSAQSNWHDDIPAYPAETLSHQDDLGVRTSGFVTGYFLEDSSTAVVSIPSFDFWGDDETSFERAIADFVSKATARDATKLIIDLQQNNGGQVSFVFEAIRQLLPSISPPPTPSRMRSHPLGDYLGQLMTQYFDLLTPDDPDYDFLVPEDWAVTDRINFDTRRNFTSWQEFYGPLAYNGDHFSKIQEYNLTSSVFDSEALYYNSTLNSSSTTTSRRDPWDATEVIILTDGVCASACSLFVEIATQELGIRTVVVGGSPKPTPMQAASGTRGALLYYSDDLDYDFLLAEAILNSNQTDINPLTAPVYLNDTGMSITYATINLRDQIRPANNVDGVPNQVLNLPANCRIYWTLDNFNNYTRLWSDVSNAVYKDQTICVGGFQDSSAQSKSSLTPRDEQELQKRTTSRVSSYIRSGLSIDLDSIPDNTPNSGFRATNSVAPATPPAKFCNTDAECGGRAMCRPTTVNCKRSCSKPGSSCGTKSEIRRVCAPRLTARSQCKGTFVPDQTNGKRASAVYGNQAGLFGGDAPLLGYCVPSSASIGQPNCL